jgi:hypothetical protein
VNLEKECIFNDRVAHCACQHDNASRSLSQANEAIDIELCDRARLAGIRQRLGSRIEPWDRFASHFPFAIRLLVEALKHFANNLATDVADHVKYTGDLKESE